VYDGCAVGSWRCPLRSQRVLGPFVHVQVFLPGLAEITEMAEALERRLTPKGKPGGVMMVRGLAVVLHVLHSLVPQDEQEAALQVRSMRA